MLGAPKASSVALDWVTDEAGFAWGVVLVPRARLARVSSTAIDVSSMAMDCEELMAKLGNLYNTRLQ